MEILLVILLVGAFIGWGMFAIHRRDQLIREDRSNPRHGWVWAAYLPNAVAISLLGLVVTAIYQVVTTNRRNNDFDRIDRELGTHISDDE